MRGSRYLEHSRRCATCGNGRLCQDGREILTAGRGECRVSPVPVSKAAQSKLNIRALVIGSAL